MLDRFVTRLRRGVHRWEYNWGRRVMSKLRQKWIIFRHPHATIRFGRGVHVGPGFSVDIPAGGTFIAGDGCDFRHGFRAEIFGNGRIVFGKNCAATYYVLMQCTTSIDIGDRCMFGQSTIVVDGQHRFRDLDTPMLEQGYDYDPVVIEDDATVMTKCTIMSSIGKRAVVGANSVVTKPVPAYTIVVGAPAKPIEYFGP